MKKTPLAQMKESHGSKEKLVDELLGLIKRPSEISKDAFRRKLLSQSNKKLVILLQRERTVKERFGTRDKLIDALVSSASGKAGEDKGYRKRLADLTTGQLLDIARRVRLG